MNQVVIVMKRYSTLSRFPEVGPRYQMHFSIISGHPFLQGSYPFLGISISVWPLSIRRQTMKTITSILNHVQQINPCKNYFRSYIFAPFPFNLPQFNYFIFAPFIPIFIFFFRLFWISKMLINSQISLILCFFKSKLAAVRFWSLYIHRTLPFLLFFILFFFLKHLHLH